MIRINRHIVLVAALVLALASWSRAAGDVKVTVTFDANNGMDDADKTAVIAAMQKKYDDAGLTNVKFSTMAGGDLTLNFEATAPEKKFGDSDKKGKKARELSKFTAADLTTFDTAAKRRNVWAESGAHEVGHLLCAVHNLDNPPSIMTKGNKVTDAQRAADGRDFTGADVNSIKMGIMMLMAGKSWDLDAKFDQRTDFWSIPGLNQTSNRNDNSIMSFTTQISDPTWSFGFINDVGEYVERVAAGSSQGASEFEPGDYGNFAIEKNGTVVEFDRMFDTVVPSLPHTSGTADLAEFPYSSALTTYYSRLDLFFGDVSLPHVTLDASPFSVTDGFALQAPEPTSVALLTGFAILHLASRRRHARRLPVAT